MALRIVCAGFMIRHPAGGHLFHHLQYLVGLKGLGHQVTFVEHYGWPLSCYDPAAGDMSDDPSVGISIVRPLLAAHDFDNDWCFLAADGTSYGLTKEALSARCREADLLLNLSNINWIDQFDLCRRRALVDTDPVFSQIGGFGLGGPFDRYHALFTFGENVHRSSSTMPTGGAHWLPTRQPVVLDMWPVQPAAPNGPMTSVINWRAYGDTIYEGRTYGQKDRQFEEMLPLPGHVSIPMLLAVNAPRGVRERLASYGWQLSAPGEVTRTVESYQRFLAESRGEFCVAKHAYVVTRSGWFSDRSSAYMATGRPVVVEDTGFSDNLPCGDGLITFSDLNGAVRGIQSVIDNYDSHCLAARQIVEEHFDANKVLTKLLADAL